MAKNKMQMVDDDQIENVGIMSGFMDDLDEIMGELDDEMEDDDEGDESDMANMLDRRPDSPEILMNNLRGDYRSIDARREELADLVGYNAASETPDAVLAMLQPVLAKQGIGALPPMNAPMPPEMAAPGGVGSLPMDQGPMAAPPMMPPAPAPAPQAPIGMKKGGIVQFFQDGSGPAGVTPPEDAYAAYPPDVVAEAIRRVQQLAARGPETVDVPDVGARTRELTPMYAEILGTQDKDAMRSQMLFDIAKTALGFAGNVGPQGQPLTGSFGARLATAASELPAQIGARSAAARAAETQARLAALQQAQGERASAQETNLQREKDYNELLMKIATQKRPAELLTPEQIESLGLQEGLPWQMESDGSYSIAGGRPPVPLVDMGENTLEKVTATAMAEGVIGEYNQARAAASNIRKIDETIKLLNEGNVDTGFGAEFRQNVRRVQELFADDPERINTLSDTELLNSALGTEVFGAISALGVGARGLDTPAEREFLREVVAGRLGLTKDTLLEMARIRRRAEENNIRMWNETLSSGRADPVIRTSQGMLPNQPLTVPPDPIAAASGDDQDRAARVRQLLGRQ